MAENILREPENPKYHTFKHENDTIKRRLIQPKGALEYALAVSRYRIRRFLAADSQNKWTLSSFPIRLLLCSLDSIRK